MGDAVATLASKLVAIVPSMAPHIQTFVASESIFSIHLALLSSQLMTCLLYPAHKDALLDKLLGNI